MFQAKIVVISSPAAIAACCAVETSADREIFCRWIVETGEGKKKKKKSSE